MDPVFSAIQHQQASLHLNYSIQAEARQLTGPLATPVHDNHISFSRHITILGTHTFKVKYVLETDTLIKLHHLSVRINLPPIQQYNMMAEGFQCWSTTCEQDASSTSTSISLPVAWVTKFDLQGDYNFIKYPNKEGVVQSTAYTYFRPNDASSIVFLGSLSEDSGYTYWITDFNANQLTFYKDIQGKTVTDRLELEWLVEQGNNEQSAWQTYAQQFFNRLPGSHAAFVPERIPDWNGFTTWYQYYEDVTEKDVLDCLDAFVGHGYPIDVFQIDDGFEQAIGDWLLVDKKKFPRGMKHLADRIRDHKMVPGIWLAPFAVGLKSQLIQDHPDWLVMQEDGQPLLSGPNWGGFRALDIYLPEVRDYLKQVFDTVIDDWGFRLLKLDFLFATAMVPRLGKTRGEIMWDAVTMVQEWTDGRARVLASGVTLPAVWGRLPYSRVSSDAAPWWDHTLLRLAHVRERVSTLNALVSTLNRWPMNNVMFASDPDVFFIRSNKNKLTLDERHTLVSINHILGKLTLMSDNVDLYTQNEHALYASTFPKPRCSMMAMIRLGPDVYQLRYTCGGRHYVTITNLSPNVYRFLLPVDVANTTEMDSSASISTADPSLDPFQQEDPTVYFELGNALYAPAESPSIPETTWHNADLREPLVIKPHMTRTFVLLEKTDLFAGSTGHLLPGNEIASLEIKTGTTTKAITCHIQLSTPRVAKPIPHHLYVRFENKHFDLAHLQVMVDHQPVHHYQLLADAAPFSLLKIEYVPFPP
ncbi:glycoside hydrolase [Hesseltinella vesiculosa]|uniref:alpha-galactosidase n=1 Tax=Hesseltinella vesiculosa TaxID=101127 RepID=A0A1X2GEM1_9FUNG|nr:glycoside hydrolase [Hesseltinella vesiculosa]